MLRYALSAFPLPAPSLLPGPPISDYCGPSPVGDVLLWHTHPPTSVSVVYGGVHSSRVPLPSQETYVEK